MPDKNMHSDDRGNRGNRPDQGAGQRKDESNRGAAGGGDRGRQGEEQKKPADKNQVHKGR